VPADKVGRDNSLVADSPDCLIICVYPEVDGPTEMTIGRADQINPGYAPSFVGRVETRTGRIIIDQVDEFVVHDEAVNDASVVVTIWFSHPRWPEKVFIGID